jgi:hypothetical protein
VGAVEPTEPTWRVPPIIIIAALVGVASVMANIEWNCHSCGWDPHTVPWYQALLVVGVPFMFAPLGILALGARAVWLRTRPATIECAGASAGLALPWVYFLVTYVLCGF